MDLTESVSNIDQPKSVNKRTVATSILKNSNSNKSVSQKSVGVNRTPTKRSDYHSVELKAKSTQNHTLNGFRSSRFNR